LERLLSELAPAADDTVVLLGDVVDRGPDTRGAIDLLLDWRTRCRMVLVKGNHEEMLLESLDDENVERNWLACGGMETLRSYGGGLDQIPDAHLAFLQSSAEYLQTPKYVCVHANLEPGVPLADQNSEFLRWTRFTGREKPLPTGQRVFCGHTPQPSGLPYLLPGWACIDTFAWGPGWLTCVDPDLDRMYQANEAGRFRQGPLL
jgi:serine/threonine protein phosphatase 1